MASPYFLPKRPKIIQCYGTPGKDLDVSFEVIVFNTAHFQLLKHERDKSGKSGLRIMSTPRDVTLLRLEPNRQDAYRYKITYKFRNLTTDDYGNYSIMSGNTFGYDVKAFTLLDEKDRGKFNEH